MGDFDVDNWTVNSYAEGMLETFDDLESDVRALTTEERAWLVSRVATLLEVPAIVYSQADLVVVSAEWNDEEMTDEQLEPHRELATKAYQLLPRLLEKAEQDHSTLEWALSNARSDMEMEDAK